MIIINTSSTVVLHVWHYYSTYLLFFTAYNYDYYYNYNYYNYNRVHITQTQTHNTQKQHFSLYFCSCPISFAAWLFCYYANSLTVSFLYIFPVGILSLRPLPYRHYCFFCYWFDMLLYSHICAIYIHTFVHVCIDWLFILPSINQIVILWWSLILYKTSSQATPLSVCFVCAAACYANFILCLSNSSVLWQRIASVLFFCLSAYPWYWLN